MDDDPTAFVTRKRDNNATSWYSRPDCHLRRAFVTTMTVVCNEGDDDDRAHALVQPVHDLGPCLDGRHGNKAANLIMAAMEVILTAIVQTGFRIDHCD